MTTAVKRVLITGMSATGKSTVLERMAELGHRTVDTDYDAISEQVPFGDGQEWLLREDRMRQVLSEEDPRVLFVAATARNQVKFYPQFDYNVLLTAPVNITIQRLATRTNNPYGKQPEQVAEVLHFKDTVEPLLRRSATVEIDTSAPLDDVIRSIRHAVGLD